MGGGNKGYFKDSTARENITDVNGQITNINNLLLPVSSVVKKFVIGNPNTTIDTGIKVNSAVSIGFIALVSSHESYNRSRVNIYIGGVAHNKQDGTCGDLNVSRLGGIGVGEGAEGENLSFSVVNDKLQMTSSQYQGALRIALILTTSA